MNMRIDGGMGSLAHVFRTSTVPAESTPGGSRPPDQVFPRIPRLELESIIANAAQTGDMSQLDVIDNFRQTLPQDLQAEYDLQLEALRNDPRVQFVYINGAQSDPAMEDMMLRGILAAAFGRPGLLDQALDARLAAGQDNVMQIIVSPDDVPVADLEAQGASTVDADGNPVPLDGGLVTSAGDIFIDNDFMLDCLEYGENTLLHEFGHVVQYGGSFEATGAATFPIGFPDVETVIAEFQSPEFQLTLEDMPYGALNGAVGGETFATLLNIFKQYPAIMSNTSPEMYVAFVEYYGVDPLAPR